MNMCECGCNQTIPLRDKRGRLRFFKRGHGSSKNRPKGSNHWQWNGGKAFDGKYIRILAPKHPKADSNGRVREHILVMEQKLGRYLQSGEIVHHINGVKTDNRPENLELMSTRSKHARYHFHKQWVRVDSVVSIQSLCN